jgi:CheY-like chemotaxis protein
LLNSSAYPAAFNFIELGIPAHSETRRIMIAAASILTISRDRVLQQTRTFILEQAGYSVSAALNDKDAIGFVEAPNDIRLVLMCHSVPEASRMFLVTRIKTLNPTLPILMLYNGYDPTQAKVDGSLHSLETPEAMLDMIGFMTRNIGVHV